MVLVGPFKNREHLRVACRLYGGNKAVAQKAGIDNANLGKWLKGAPKLSEAKIARLLASLGLPNGEPDTSHVHIWTHSSAFHDLSPALSLFFPKGAEIARAEWSGSGLRANLKRLTRAEWLPELYAITDGHVRALLRLPTGLVIQKKNLGKNIVWKDGLDNEALLLIGQSDLKAWLEGEPSIQQFDSAWSGLQASATEADVIQAVKDEGISLEEAIFRIRRS